ncbi:mCG140388 [Mus musculus]|nr:mCG140388 [Mus musculus]
MHKEGQDQGVHSALGCRKSRETHGTWQSAFPEESNDVPP